MLRFIAIEGFDEKTGILRAAVGTCGIIDIFTAAGLGWGVIISAAHSWTWELDFGTGLPLPNMKIDSCLVSCFSIKSFKGKQLNATVVWKPFKQKRDAAACINRWSLSKCPWMSSGRFKDGGRERKVAQSSNGYILIFLVDGILKNCVKYSTNCTHKTTII